MIFRVAVTRPEPQASQTAQRLTAMGFEPFIAPLLQPVPGDPPGTADGIGSIALTSRTAAAMLAPHTAFHRLPVYAVGAATADEARSSGFIDVISADGTADELFEHLSGAPEPIVHMAGSDQRGDLVERLVAGGRKAERRIVYHMKPNKTLEVPPGPVNAVLLYSPRTAKVFARRAKAPEWQGATCVAMSAAIAEAVGDGFKTVVSAAPNQKSLIDALLKLRDSAQG
ncbi:uroporphyrinogen-III synthase [Acuticoccus kandeliae]|uniref:uroporphyrinogen-III synthase n=1 Tax=Acuticoccus kandeliae TaxID=2073160 RepID=UPI000D3E04DA|nr:uroporphyrinogen-III synthase [Acuticoccus kandeliae]